MQHMNILNIILTDANNARLTGNIGIYLFGSWSVKITLDCTCNSKTDKFIIIALYIIVISALSQPLVDHGSMLIMLLLK